MICGRKLYLVSLQRRYALRARPTGDVVHLAIMVITGYSSLIGLGKSADQTSRVRDLGANVAPRPERRAGSQTHKSRRGLGESRYRGTLGDPGASLGQLVISTQRLLERTAYRPS